MNLLPPSRRPLVAAIALPWLLAGCAATAPAPPTTPQPLAAQWHAPLPHGGRLQDLQQWWSHWGDPLLPRLIEAAQHASPTLAQARARLADARAARTAGGAALLPSLDLTASASRGRLDLGTPAGTVSSASLQAGWELDLFGALRAGADAAQARLESSQAGWHDARVSVAAEVARTYAELRACEAIEQQAEVDARSRAETARVTGVAATAGLRAPATAELARASAAQGMAAVVLQRAQCALLAKSLVAMTALDEPTLRTELAAGSATLPEPPALGLDTVPAQVLAQRPDIHAAARDVAAASADAAQASAQRWPRVTLAGSLGRTRSAGAGASADGAVWTVGPVAVSFPLFDGGTRRANAQAARVRYEAATATYAGRLREAVREVEAALVTLGSTAQRSDSARIAAEGFERSHRATLANYQAGGASLFELEDTRRSLATARTALIELRRERLLAWIGLYRALGGGWSAPDNDTAPDALPPAFASATVAPTPPRN
ncbi:efflux transporter outer membrane subunit [Acidovorax sp.]|uniref:efflux transporter outer membrane subunit n=1 Tax=Acidovorax sp. TaxID=1872122 RepID=UPI002ACE71EE|nr:efflux transporter outer membrane subunit [Acidovorax sp.]MDZ7862602.1 efflux transporter outer membrane subunit [Acidovorax sp.]